MKISAKTGATYYLNGTKQKAGTYKYTGRVTVMSMSSAGAYYQKETNRWNAKLESSGYSRASFQPCPLRARA